MPSALLEEQLKNLIAPRNLFHVEYHVSNLHTTSYFVNYNLVYTYANLYEIFYNSLNTFTQYKREYILNNNQARYEFVPVTLM